MKNVFCEQYKANYNPDIFDVNLFVSVLEEITNICYLKLMGIFQKKILLDGQDDIVSDRVLEDRLPRSSTFLHGT
jgi:hypothetical protein